MWIGHTPYANMPIHLPMLKNNSSYTLTLCTSNISLAYFVAGARLCLCGLRNFITTELDPVWSDPGWRAFVDFDMVPFGMAAQVSGPTSYWNPARM